MTDYTKERIKRKLYASRFTRRHVVPICLWLISKQLEIRGKKAYKRDYDTYVRLNKGKGQFQIDKAFLCPQLKDRYSRAGGTGQYFWQDLWAARLIAKNNPERHYDIGSRIDGFIGHLASFRENIFLIDIRPFADPIPGVSFQQADATNLDGIPDESIESISALCSLEHFGLGRYGDPIDPDGWIKALKSIERVLSPNGHAYISVPIGYEHLQFNSDRVFYAETIIDALPSLKLVEFSTTYGKEIEYDTPIHKYDDERDNWGERYGLFHFMKNA